MMGDHSQVRIGLSLLKPLSTAEISDFLSQGLKSGLSHAKIAADLLQGREHGVDRKRDRRDDRRR